MIIDGINNILSDNEFKILIKDIFGESKLVEAITADEFSVVIETWSNMNATNTLPEPRQITPPSLEKQKVTEEEEFGQSLFGDLFSS